MNLLTQFPTASKNLLFAFVLILSSFQLHSQTFQTAIGYGFPTDERGASGLISNTGDYIVLGSNHNHPSGLFNPAGDMELLRLNTSGNLVLPSKIIGQDVGESGTWIEKATGCNGNAGYIIAGNEFNGPAHNMLLTFTNGAGTPQWVKRIGVLNDDEVSACVKQDGAGNFILVGTKTDANTGIASIQAVKTDCNGNLLWEKVYRINGQAKATSVTAFATFQSACGNLPNEYFITGHVAPSTGGAEEVFILSVNVATGNVSWMKTYDVAPNAGDFGTCIQGRCGGAVPPTGQLWVSGYSLENSGSDPKKVLMLQTDLGGALQWAKNFDVQSSPMEFATHFQFAANNKLVLTGKAEETGVSDPPETGQCLLMRMNDNGSAVDWTRVYTMGFASQGNRVEPTTTDEYFITGHTYEIIQPHQFDYNILAIRTDQLGETKSGCYHSPATVIIPRQPVTTAVQPTPIIPQDFFGASLQTVLFDDKQTFCPPVSIDPCDTLGLVAAFNITGSGNTFNFTDLSNPGSGTIFSWNWTFGDAGTSNLQNPTHTYAGPGVYTVCLIITGGTAGMLCSDTICKDVVVQGHPIDPCDTLGLVAAFNITGSGNTFNFTDLSSPGSGTIFSWNWTFGDAGTSNLQNPTHTYAGPGVYTVCLIITGGTSGIICRDTICKDVVVQGHPIDPCDTLGLTANFGITGSGNTLNFNDLSSPGSGSIFSWSWTFGDAGTSSLQNPTHTYAGPNVYVVCLIVTGGNAVAVCRDTVCKEVLVPFEQPDTCAGNLVLNGNFSQGLVPGNLGSGGAISNWATWTNTPQVIAFDNCQDPGAIQMWGNQVVGESVWQSVSFVAGGIYELRFCGKWLNQAQPNVQVRFRASTGFPGSYQACGANCDEIFLSPVLPAAWTTYTSAPWTATQNYNTLTISIWNSFAINDGAYVSWARVDDVCIRRIGTSATHEASGLVDARLFPNPTTGDVTVEFGEATEAETLLTVLDMTGRKVQQSIVDQGQNTATLTLAHCPAGVYVVRALRNGQAVWTEKVVKE